MEEFQRTVRETLVDRGPVGLLVKLEAPYFFDAETVDYMDEVSDWFDRVAFVVASPMGQAAVRAFMFAAKDPRPSLMTDSYDEALEWLRGSGKEEATARFSP